MKRQRRPITRRRPAVATAAAQAVEPLETRRLMSVTLNSVERLTGTTLAPVLANTATPASNSLTLSNYFTDDKVPGTVVTFQTTGGPIAVALTDNATPLTVANFLSYVNSGAYTNTFFHRSANVTNGAGGSPTAPGDIIQGGGYDIQNGQIAHITTNAPVADEYTKRAFGDTDGTLAMAKTSSANSATSEFYFNYTDNTSALDTPTTDSSGVTTSYTPFGVVLSGFNTVTAIASLPTYDIDDSSLPTVPVTGISAADVAAKQPISASNLVYVNSVAAVAGTTYTATSDNPSLVTPTVANGVLSFAYGTGKTGVADVTVTATNFDGTSVSSTFPVTVPGAAATPTAVNDTEAPVITGQSQTFSPLLNDTSTAAAALTASGLTITTAPSHGTATVDATTGKITYTPTAGYTGADSLAYTTTDTAGAVTNAATVALTVVPVATTVSLGGANPKVLTYTQPDGAVATIKLVGGGPTVSAVVTFADYNVTVTKAAGGYTATGTGATVSTIAVDGGRANNLPSLNITSTKPVSIGGVTDPNAMTNIVAPTTTLTGVTSIGGGLGGGLQLLDVAGLSGATVTLANRVFGTTLTIPTAVNSSLTAVGGVNTLTSTSWTVTDGGTYTFKAASIGRMQVTTAFADALQLSGTGYDIITAKVGAPTAPWDLGGSLYSVQVTNPGAAWNVSGGGVIQKMAVTGNLSSTVSVAAINTMTVTGNLDNAVVETSSGFSAKAVQLRTLRVGGSISDSVVFATGNVGSITAAAATGSRIYAGISQSVAQAGTLPTTATNVENQARIQSFTLPASGTFVNTQIAAYTINAARLGQVTTSNNATTFGVAGHAIKSIYANLGTGGVLNVSGAPLKTAATFSAYATARKLTLGDFDVSLF